jgi:hypothetical protein
MPPAAREEEAEAVPVDPCARGTAACAIALDRAACRSAGAPASGAEGGSDWPGAVRESAVAKSGVARRAAANACWSTEAACAAIAEDVAVWAVLVEGPPEREPVPKSAWREKEASCCCNRASPPCIASATAADAEDADDEEDDEDEDEDGDPAGMALIPARAASS